MSHYTGSVPGTEPAGQWLKRAACKEDPEAMFPSSNEGEIEDAKGYCRRCPVDLLCGQWALEHREEHGVWGGLSEAERRALLRQRRASQPISIDDYTGIPRTSAAGRTLEESWTAGTESDGEHLLWIGPQVIHQPGGRGVTPNRLAFFLDRGHWPEGDVKRSCDVDRCVRPAHLADKRERAEARDLAIAA
jgi:WhiB family redox-sensing transcriptional regulator